MAPVSEHRVEMVIEHAAGRAAVSVSGGGPLDGSLGDAALALTLLPAMRTGEALTIDAPVSPMARRGAERIQDIFTTWDRALRPRAPWYRRVSIEAPVAVPGSGGGATACFFTGGVDSFHSALTHRAEIDTLVYVHGFDVRLDDTALRAAVSSRLNRAADAMGLALIEMETDLRDLGDQTRVGWPDHHGAALACVAHLLGGQRSRWLVPATHTYAHLEGLGSHPLLDPLWSSEAVEIVHDGAGATRVDKLRRIAGEDAASAHLRVCWENPDGAYNCGRCEKCVRTGVAIRVAGVEGRFATVPSPSLADVARVRVTGRGSAWHDARADLVRTGANPRLRAAIDVALARHQLARWRLTGRWFR